MIRKLLPGGTPVLPEDQADGAEKIPPQLTKANSRQSVV